MRYSNGVHHNIARAVDMWRNLRYIDDLVQDRSI